MDLMNLFEVELRKERATALSRIGSKLEAELNKMRTIEAQVAGLPPGPLRQQRINEHAEARKKAEEFRHYLIVQREALGLINHQVVEEIYPIPSLLG